MSKLETWMLFVMAITGIFGFVWFIHIIESRKEGTPTPVNQGTATVTRKPSEEYMKLSDTERFEVRRENFYLRTIKDRKTGKEYLYVTDGFLLEVQEGVEK